MEPCTGVYRDARSAMYGDVRRCTPVYGGVRLRGPRGGKGDVYGNTLGLWGACPRMCGRVRGCTPLYEGARWCPVRPVLATSSFPAKACVAKKGG